MSNFINYAYCGYGRYLLSIPSIFPNIAELEFEDEELALETKKIWEEFINKGE